MVIALFYYLKIILPLFDACDKNAIFQEPKTNFSQKFVITVVTIITVIFGLCPELLIQICKFVAYNI